MVAVGGRAAVPGHVLEHRQHAALHQPFARPPRRSPRPCRPSCRRRGCRSPDRPRSPARRRCGRQSTSMPSAARSARDQPRAEPRGRKSRGAVAIVDARRKARPADSSASAAAPSRCTRPPSWSISTGASARPTASRMLVDQGAHLLRRVDIALEQDEAPRVGVAQKARAPARRAKGRLRPVMKARWPSARLNCAAPGGQAALFRCKVGRTAAGTCANRGAAASIDLQSARLDRAFPARDLVDDEPGEILRAAALGRDAGHADLEHPRS